MACNRLFPQKSMELDTYSTTTSFSWVTDFVLCPGISLVDFLMLLRNIDGNFQAKPVYQTASVQADNPNTPTVISTGSYSGSAGYTGYHESLAITDQLLIRFGLAYKNSSGSNLGRALANLTVALRQCGSAIGSGGAQIQPGMMTSTDVNFFPIGSFQPIVGLDKLMAAFVIEDNESTYLEYQLAIRTAKDIRAPNAWYPMEVSWANPSAGNSERNTTLLTPPGGAGLATNMFFQTGIAARKKSGAAGNPRSELKAVVAATYA